MDRREEAFRARRSSAVRIDREEAGRYGERRHGSERVSERRSRGSRWIRRTRGMDQREDRSHGESAIRADCEEARIVSKRGSRGSERYGEREAWIRERIGATGRVRSEPIARKHVREEARIVSRRGSRGSERAYITSENGKGLATHGGRAERARRARSVKNSTSCERKMVQ